MKAEIGDLGWEAVGASDSTVMILTCPECATSYFVDDSRIAAAGRVVKCSHCGARWTALPEAAPETPTTAPKPAPAPTAPLPPATPVEELVIDGPDPVAAPSETRRTAAPKREANGKVMIWAGSAAVASLLIVGAIVFRGPIVQRLPASQAAYAGLGLHVSTLTIEKVHADAGFQGGRAVLSVTGQIHNLGAAATTVPPVRVTLLDRLGKPVAVKVAKPIDGAAPGHAVRYFAITLVDPPANLHDLDVAFEADGKRAGKPVKAQVSAPAPAPARPQPLGPQPVEAKPLAPGSPDALPPPP